MKVYKNNTVKYWTDDFKKLSSFDIVSIEDMYKMYLSAYNFFKKQKFDYRLNNGAMEWIYTPDSSLKIVERHSKDFPKSKFLYLEIPYQLYEDYFINWFNRIDNPVRIDWKTIEEYIDKEVLWDPDPIDPTIGEYVEACSYGCYLSHKLYGVGTPAFNNGTYFPKRNTHRMAYTYKIKSDVPVFLSAESTEKFKIEIAPFTFNPAVDGYNHNKLKPDADIRYYFKDFKNAEIDIQNKKINFLDKDNKVIAQYIK